MITAKVGLIGIGNMGSIHAKNITEGKVPGMELKAVADISAEKRKKAAELYPDIEIFSTAGEMFELADINTVLIAVPHYDHPPLAVKAFEYGFNVISEKPAGVYTKQVMEMNEAAKKSGKLFGIMYNQRTNPQFQKIKELVENGSLGHIKRISWIITNWYRPQAYHDSAAWRSTWATEGGGTLINQNPHQLDLWQWMFGMPDKIMAHCGYGKYYDIEVEDDVTAYMEYANGTTGTYITSTGEAPGTNRLEVACDMGKLVYEDGKLIFNRNVISEREFNKTNKTPFGTPEVWKCEIPLSSSWGEQHVGILKDFVKVLNGEKKELLAPGYEGIKGLTISNSIHYSSWTGEMVDVNNFPHDKFYSKLQEKVRHSKAKKNAPKESAAVNLEGTY